MRALGRVEGIPAGEHHSNRGELTPTGDPMALWQAREATDEEEGSRPPWDRALHGLQEEAARAGAPAPGAPLSLRDDPRIGALVRKSRHTFGKSWPREQPVGYRLRAQDRPIKQPGIDLIPRLAGLQVGCCNEKLEQGLLELISPAGTFDHIPFAPGRNMAVGPTENGPRTLEDPDFDGYSPQVKNNHVDGSGGQPAHSPAVNNQHPRYGFNEDGHGNGAGGGGGGFGSTTRGGLGAVLRRAGRTSSRGSQQRRTSSRGVTSIISSDVF